MSISCDVRVPVTICTSREGWGDARRLCDVWQARASASAVDVAELPHRLGPYQAYTYEHKGSDASHAELVQSPSTKHISDRVA